MIEKQNSKFSLRKYAAIGLCGVALGTMYLANNTNTVHAAETAPAIVNAAKPQDNAETTANAAKPQNNTETAANTAKPQDNAETAVKSAFNEQDTHQVSNEHFDQTIEYKNKENDQKLSPDKKQTVDVNGYNVKSQVNVVYHDSTDDKDLATDTVNGYIGSKVNYSTDKNVKNYQDHGYAVASNNYEDGNYTKDTQNYQVNLVHRQEIKNKKVKTATRTINFVDQSGNQVAPSTVQAVKFNYSGDLTDLVTGKVIKAGTWDGDQTFEAVKPYELNGYKYIGNNDILGAKTIDHDANNIIVNAVYQAVPDSDDASANADSNSSNASSFANNHLRSVERSAVSDAKPGIVVTDQYNGPVKSALPNSSVIDDYDSKTASVFYDVKANDELVKSGVSKADAKATLADVKSPDVDGYHLVDDTQNTVKGDTFAAGDTDTTKIVTVYYAKNNQAANNDSNNSGTGIVIDKTVLNVIDYETEDGTILKKDTVSGKDGDKINLAIPDGYELKDKDLTYRIRSHQPEQDVIVVKAEKSADANASGTNQKSDSGQNGNSNNADSNANKPVQNAANTNSGNSNNADSNANKSAQNAVNTNNTDSNANKSAQNAANTNSGNSNNADSNANKSAQNAVNTNNTDSNANKPVQNAANTNSGNSNNADSNANKSAQNAVNTNNTDSNANKSAQNAANTNNGNSNNGAGSTGRGVTVTDLGTSTSTDNAQPEQTVHFTREIQVGNNNSNEGHLPQTGSENPLGAVLAGLASAVSGLGLLFKKRF